MDPTRDTPFRDVGPAWSLTVRCSCAIVQFIAAYRERHFAPDMTPAGLCARFRCQRCGGRVIEAAWESAQVGPGGLADGERRARVV